MINERLQGADGRSQQGREGANLASNERRSLSSTKGTGTGHATHSLYSIAIVQWYMQKKQRSCQLLIVSSRAGTREDIDQGDDSTSSTSLAPTGNNAVCCCNFSNAMYSFPENRSTYYTIGTRASEAIFKKLSTPIDRSIKLYPPIQGLRDTCTIR